MRTAHAGLVAAALTVLPSAAFAASPATPRAQKLAPPPHVLNIVRVKVKPKTAGAYATLEGQLIRACDRAKSKLYWIGLQGRDATDVLFLNLAESAEAWDRLSAGNQSALKQHPDVADLQQRLSKMTQSSVGTLTSRRTDVDDEPAGVDFQTMRTLRLTMVDVKPGREDAFLDAIRTSPSTDGSWMVYEASDSSTYALITLTRTKLTRKDGLSMPRSLRRSKGIFTKAETRLYTVRPGLSRLAPAAPVTH